MKNAILEIYNEKLKYVETSKETALKVAELLPVKTEVATNLSFDYIFKWHDGNKIVSMEISKNIISWSFSPKSMAIKDSKYGCEEFTGKLPDGFLEILTREFGE